MAHDKTDINEHPAPGVARRIVDIHCHCLCDLDDGPAAMHESLALCRALLADRVSAVIASPHQLGRYQNDNSAVRVRRQVAVLRDALRQEKLPLQVLPGGEVRLDERIPDLLDRDQILTLADAKRHLLLELPQEVYIDPLPLVRQLTERGIRTIISHPERNVHLATRPDAIMRLLEGGAYFQVTTTSLWGGFGRDVSRMAWHLVCLGIASFVASDAHNLADRRPCLSRTFVAIARQAGQSIARRVCIDNPAKVLAGRDVDLTARPLAWEARR